MIKIARSLQHSIYEPDNFGGLVHRRINPKSTIILFSSGRITSVGTKTEKQGIESLHNTTFEIKKLLNRPIQIEQIKTVNMVATGTFGSKIDFKKLAKHNIIEYIPEQSPGAIIKLILGTVMIFGSGKIILMGCKNKKDLRSMFSDLFFLLKKNSIIETQN